MSTVHTVLFAAGLLLSTAASAATPINESRPLDPQGRLEVHNVKGLIEVRAWDRAEVRIEGSLGKGVERLAIEGDRARLSVRVVYPKRTGWKWNDGDVEPTELRLMVPRRASLDVESVAADVVIDAVASRELSIQAVSGDVRVAAAPGSAEIESVSGDLQLTLNTAKVDVESVSGDVTLRGRLNGEVAGETVSGNLHVAGVGSALQRVNATSVSGDVTIASALAPQASVSVETVSGDVRLKLPRDTSARVRGESFSGDLSAPGASIQRPRHGPGASFEHRYGNGDADVRVQTFSGDATLQFD